MSEDSNAITSQEFDSEVIEKSHQTPVLVDFWAPWCQPCKQLMPILHQLVESLNGKVKLVTVNTDEEQELSMQLGIRSLPTVMLFANGQLKDQFSGVKPENEIRQILTPYLSLTQSETIAKSDPDNLQIAMDLINQNQILKAIPYLQKDTSLDGKLLLIKIYLQEGEIDKAQQFFDSLNSEEKENTQSQIIKSTLELIKIGSSTQDIKLQGAIEHTISINPHQGIEKLLGLLADAKTNDNTIIKNSLIIAFTLIEDAKLVSQLRRKMAALIF